MRNIRNLIHLTTTTRKNCCMYSKHYSYWSSTRTTCTARQRYSTTTPQWVTTHDDIDINDNNNNIDALTPTRKPPKNYNHRHHHGHHHRIWRLLWTSAITIVPLSALPIATATTAFVPPLSSSSFSISSRGTMVRGETVLPQRRSLRLSQKLLSLSADNNNNNNDTDNSIIPSSSSSKPPKKQTKTTTTTKKNATTKTTTTTTTKARGRPKKIPDTTLSSSSSSKEEPSALPTTTKPKRKTNTTKKKSAVGTAAAKKKKTTKKSPVKRKSPPTKNKQTTIQKSPSPPAKKAKTKKATTTTTTRIPITWNPPHDWESTYSLVEELRQDRSAPVDSDGSEALPQGKDDNPPMYRYQVLIALMLSSQTKDAIVGETMRTLQQHGLTVENIAKTSPEVLDKMIFKVGFHNNKTKYILQTTKILIEKYNGDIPPTAEEMIKELPGVGPKMAFIIENVAWPNAPCTGIGVDTHMHRMFNQLGWVKSNNPEQTRKQLESWLPESYWRSVNLVWVGFGQEVQQFKPKLLAKVLESSRPHEALKLVKKLGLDYRKEAAKEPGLDEKLKQVLSSKKE